MKIGVTGPNGYIGKALVSAGAVPLRIDDIAIPEQIDREIEKVQPDVIVHLAAKSDPDFCERDTVTTAQVNCRGTYNVFFRATTNEIPCVFLSSSQIWSGMFWERPHKEDDKKTPPVNIYGMSKLAAEGIVSQIFDGWIIRSSFVFDAKRLASKTDALRRGERLYESVFIKRSFIHLADFVSMVLTYCSNIKKMPKVLHLAGSKTVSWYTFMKDVASRSLLDDSLVRPRFIDHNGFAPRPYNAGLNTELAQSLGFYIPSYTEGIERMRNES